MWFSNWGSKETNNGKLFELEAESRGLYTGALGHILPGEVASELLFNVAIRTVILNSEIGEMGIGSGIVYDSQIEEEWKECLLKGKFLKRINSRFQLIETFRYDSGNGVYLRLERHLARLSKSAQALGFEFEEVKLRESLEKLKGTLEGDRRVRVALNQDEININHELFKRSDDNYKVIFCKTPIDKKSMFQKFKTSHRDFYETNYQKAISMGYDEVLFVNDDGKVVEASRHNIFAKTDNQF